MAKFFGIFLIFALIFVCTTYAKPVDDAKIEPEEDMETAEAMIFRPLFSYRQQQVQKKRIQNERQGNAFNRPPPPPPAFNGKKPPPVLVYDKKTNSYYPAMYNPMD